MFFLFFFSEFFNLHKLGVLEISEDWHTVNFYLTDTSHGTVKFVQVKYNGLEWVKKINSKCDIFRDVLTSSVASNEIISVCFIPYHLLSLLEHTLHPSHTVCEVF